MHINPDSPHYKGFRNYQVKLQKRLRALRKEYGYTQLELANCGVSVRHYTRMEQDPNAILSIWQLYKIAAFYEISLAELCDI